MFQTSSLISQSSILVCYNLRFFHVRWCYIGKTVSNSFIPGKIELLPYFKSNKTAIATTKQNKQKEKKKRKKAK